MISPTKRLKSFTLAALGVTLAAVAVNALGERPVTGAVGPVDTRVVNTAANPVPTSAVGTTAVTGTVSVASSPASPLSVQEVARPDPIGGIPINRTIEFTTLGLIYTVPAGKVLILEQVYGSVGEVNEATPVYLYGISEPGQVGLRMLLSLLSTPSGDGVHSGFSQQARAYFYPGDIQVGCYILRECSFSLTGRLVDAPQ